MMLNFIKWVYKLITPNWAIYRHPDPNHFFKRRFTTRYKQKQQRVKNVWIIMGCVIVICPVIQFIVPILLFTSFVSFCILDET